MEYSIKRNKILHKPLRQEDVIKRYQELYGNKFDYSLFKYVNSITKAKIKCNTCGTIFEQIPNSHLSGHGCPNCRNKYFSDIRKISQEEIIKRFIEIHGDKYDYSKVVYVGLQIKVIVICPVHGEFEQTPNNHLKGHGCAKCGDITQALLLTLDQKEVIERFIWLHGDRFGYDDFVYKGMSEKGAIKCYEHGLFWQTPNNHLKGQGCPKCNYSKGEAALEVIFKKHNIKYEPQFKLPFYNFEYDFYLPDYGVIVEFHGRQHYEPVDRFGGLEKFKKQIEIDAFKRSLAREYKILLIEIHYKHLDHKKIQEFEQLFLKELNNKFNLINWICS